MVYFFITLCIGIIGGFIGRKTKIPAGVMMMSMFFVALFNISSGKGYMYPFIRKIMQIISGMIIGSKINKKALESLKKLILPAILFVFIIAFYNLFIANIVFRLTSIDLPTAIFSTTLGGMTDLTILSSEFNVQTPIVALLHLIRFLVCICILPLIAKYMSKKDEIKMNVDYKTEKVTFNIKDFLMCLVVSGACGFVLDSFHINAGIMIGSMLASSFFNIQIKNYKVHPEIVFYLKCVAGSFIGLKFTKDLILMLPSLSKAALIILVGLVIYIIVVSQIMRKLTGFNHVTSLLMCAPGGLSDMVLLSEELGGDSYSVAAMQTLRMFSIVLVVPMIVGTLN